MARGGNDIGVLYYIESEEQSAVKIGFAENLSLRLANLQTGNPSTLKVRWTQNATRDAETEIHALLKPFSIGREWYADDGLADMVLDELGYELLDKAEADCVRNGTEYEDACERAYLTASDVRKVLRPLVEEYAAWIAAGRPDDERAASDMAILDAMDASTAPTN